MKSKEIDVSNPVVWRPNLWPHSITMSQILPMKFWESGIENTIKTPLKS